MVQICCIADGGIKITQAHYLLLYKKPQYILLQCRGLVKLKYFSAMKTLSAIRPMELKSSLIQIPLSSEVYLAKWNITALM
jgi:hypothetical protein